MSWCGVKRRGSRSGRERHRVWRDSRRHSKMFSWQPTFVARFPFHSGWYGWAAKISFPRWCARSGRHWGRAPRRGFLHNGREDFLMRTTWMAVAMLGVAGLAGCDAFSAQSNVVATSAGRRLETDRLVSMLAAVRAPVTPEGAEVITDIWVNMNLFAQARVEGHLASDSAAVARIMWPQILQGRMQAWQDTLKERRPKPNDASADSAYDAGNARVFQHIIVTP